MKGLGAAQNRRGPASGVPPRLHLYVIIFCVSLMAEYDNHRARCSFSSPGEGATKSNGEITFPRRYFLAVFLAGQKRNHQTLVFQDDLVSLAEAIRGDRQSLDPPRRLGAAGQSIAAASDREGVWRPYLHPLPSVLHPARHLVEGGGVWRRRRLGSNG